MEVKKPQKQKKNVKRTYQWQNRESAVYNTQFKGHKFSVPLQNAIEIQNFERFCDDNISKHIAYHTNLYNTQ